MSAQNNGSGAGDFVSGLQDAVRQNPVSAALVGMGLLWMFTGGNRLSTAAAFFPAVAKGAAAGAADGLLRTAGVVSAAGEGVKSLGERFVDGVRDTLSEATAATGDAATRSVEGVKSVAAQSAAQLRSTTAEIGAADYGVGPLQQNLKQTFERQPLLLGAIGLAIGAGMASAFAATQFEKDAVGETAERVTDQLKEMATTQVDRATAAAERTLEAIKDEAQAQGLTAAAAKEGAAAIGKKVKTVAAAARSKS
jgi:hypothetical protein